MSYEYEQIDHQDNLPLRIFFHSIKACAYHWHRELELLLILQGSVLVQIEGHTHLLKKDDLFLINSGEIHLSHETDDRNLILALQIDPTFAKKYDPDILRRRFEFNPVAMNCPEDSRFVGIRSLIAQSMWEMRVKKPGFQFKVEGLLHELLATLLREFPHEFREPKAEEKFQADNAEFFPRLKRIVRFVEKHYQEKISLSDFAQQENLSAGYLARFFKEKTGCTIGEFVNLIRLRKSLTALTTTEATISEIALDYGFPSVKAYNILFKRTYQTTPTAWRKNARGRRSASGKNLESVYGQYEQHDALALLSFYLPETSVKDHLRNNM